MRRKRDQILEWFNRYSQSFILATDDLQRNIDLKRDHSLRVRDKIVYISEKLFLPEDERVLAEITAILHDTGRFEQLRKFGTFSDRNSVNHAELGVRIIKEQNLLCGFDPASENIIIKSMLYHNRASLPEAEDESVLFFSRLLRDADKLDIWKVVLEYYSGGGDSRNRTIELGLPETPGISRNVYEDIMNHRIVDIMHVKNINDFKLLQAGLVFDINFQPSIERILERGYLPGLKETLPDLKEVAEAFHEIETYLEMTYKSLAVKATI